jgi:competence ComEA-like helix-hairpin-helix protein
MFKTNTFIVAGAVVALLSGSVFASSHSSKHAKHNYSKHKTNYVHQAHSPAEIGGVVHINTADTKQMTKLKGVGAKRAAQIVAYRVKNGPFVSVEALQNVSGIGSKGAAKIKQANPDNLAL